MDILTIIGLAGISLVFSSSEWTAGFRTWAAGYESPANPVRAVGDMVSSPLAFGAAVGSVYSLVTSFDPFVSGGLVALVAWVGSVVYRLIEVRVLKSWEKPLSQGEVASVVRGMLEERDA